MVLDINFPDEEPYSRSLGRFRRRIKPYLRNLPIRRREGGVSIEGTEADLFRVMLLLGNEYEVTRRDNGLTS